MPRKSEIGRAALGGAGIVISILLAFAIDAGWGERSQRLAEEAVINGIREEFESNLEFIDDLVAEHQWADSTLISFFAASRPETESEAESVVESLTAGLLVGDLLDPSMGTLEMLLNSGQLNLISDSDLLALLWEWKRLVEDLEDDAPGLYNNARDNRLLLGRLGVRGITDELLPSWRVQFDRLRSSQELSAQARTAVIDRRSYREELNALRVTTELVLDRLGRR